MIFAICFIACLFPVNAFAAESVDWSVIKNTVLGVYHESSTDEASGIGWTYSNGTVTIAEGTIVEGDVTPFGGEASPAVNNIHSNGGIFTGTINGGNFTGTVINEGTINRGTFEETVINNGTIARGAFNGEVINNGSINNGTFTETSTIKNNADATLCVAVSNGTVENYGNITGGRFTKIINYSGGTINENRVDCNNIVYGSAGGNDDGNNTPNPNPNPTPGDNNSNSENTTSDNNEYEFVEPVIIVVPEGQKYVDDVMEQLATVPTDGKVVIDTKDWYCFNRTMAEKVTNMKDVTVTIKYKYQGKRYEVTIPAGSDVVSLLGETGFVGFRYLDLVFGGREITE